LGLVVPLRPAECDFVAFFISLHFVMRRFSFS
jgi:hypothetical protein